MNRTTHNHRNLHGKMLTGAIVAALSLGTAGTAAANSGYAYDGNQALTLQNYLQMIANQQALSGPVSASVVDGAAGYRGPAANGQLTVSGNTIQALTLNTATGLLGANGADNAIDLGLLGVQNDGLPPGDANQGIGILNGQLATASATTLLDNADIGLDLTDYAAGNATVTGNTLAATTLVNGAGNRATGDLNTAPFSSTTAGQVSADYTPAGAAIDADGGVTIGNAQLAVGVDSSATITGSDISMVNTGDSSSAPMDVADNTVAASDTGNRGDNRFSATAGAVSYTGAVGVVNGQANLGGSIAASVSGTDIGAQDVESIILDGAYAGAMNVSGNSLSANAQGNDAAAVDASGSLVRGNVISFGQGIDVAGTGASGHLGLSFANDEVHGSATADLALLNSQGNQDNTIDGSVDGSRIGGEVSALDGGSMTASGNRVSAGAGGNSAINLVSADGASFAASVAAGNQQTNDHTDISASASGVEVGTQVAGSADLADVTVGDSSIRATASGSSAQTVVDLQGSNFAAAGTGAVAASGSNAGFTALDTGTAGVVAGNLQANYGAGNTISADASGSTLGALFGADVTDSEVSVGGSAIAASASGNGASTGIAVGGATGALTASLGSGQYNANDVTATAEGNFLGIQSAAGGFDGSNLTVGDSSLSARASANQATNSLTTDFDSSLTLASGGTGSIINPVASSNAANGALIVLNDQINDGADVTATTGGGQIGIAGGDMVDVTASVQGNSASASAIGNSTGNELAVGAGNLQRTGGAGTLAALGNLQQMSGDSTAAIADLGIGFSGGNLTSVDGSVSGNSVNAFAAGNMAGGDGGAGNRLSVSGTNQVDTGLAGGTAIYDHDSSAQIAVAAYVLQNAQSSTSGARSATVDATSIGAGSPLGMDGYADSDSFSVSDNGISADARDNYAANSLGLDFDGSLTTTAALQSTQSSEGSMESSVTNSEIGVTAAGYLDGSLTVSGNAVAAKAVANTVSNQLAVDASRLAGNGDGLASEPGYRGAAVDGDVAYVVADYGLSNVQSRDGGDIDVSVGNTRIGVVATNGSLTGGTATVSGNSVTALGQGNSAGNGLALSGSGVDASAALFNSQSMGSNVSAEANGVNVNAYMTTGVSGGVPVTVSGNSIGAYAGLNEAVNALSVDAANSVGGSVVMAGASNDDARFGYVGAAADYAVTNGQGSSGNATATLDNVRSSIMVGNGGVTGAGGSLTVTGNQLDAQASGNTATNSVALNGAGSVGATAAVFSTQGNGGDIGAVVNNSDVTAGNIAGFNGDIDGSTVTVNDNRVTGSASGNSATNAIRVSSAVLNGARLNTAESGTDGTTSTAVADYALNNVQGNSGAISSTMSNVSVGTNLVGGVGSVLNSHATIGSNMVVASASGNSASNSIVLASAAGMPSAALTNSQVNTASVTSSITGARVGMIATGMSNSPVTVTGNTISATATGNSAVNQIGLGK